jgi:hypothetical protein
MNDHPFSVDSAREAADQGRLGPWVAEFLGSPGSDNAELAALLNERTRHWLGPVQLPISQLNRLAGPPGDPVLCPVDDEEWSPRVEDLADKVEDGFEPPPVIVVFRDGQLVLEDGNHRVEGIRRVGLDDAWAVVGFETSEELARFTASIELPR